MGLISAEGKAGSDVGEDIKFTGIDTDTAGIDEEPGETTDSSVIEGEQETGIMISSNEVKGT